MAALVSARGARRVAALVSARGARLEDCSTDAGAVTGISFVTVFPGQSRLYFKEFCPGFPQNSFRDAKMSGGVPNHSNTFQVKYSHYRPSGLWGFW